MCVPKLKPAGGMGLAEHPPSDAAAVIGARGVPSQRLLSK